MLAPSPHASRQARIGVGRRGSRVGSAYDSEIARLVGQRLSLPAISTRLRLVRPVIERRIELLGLKGNVAAAARGGAPFNYLAFASAEAEQRAADVRPVVPRSPRRVVEVLSHHIGGPDLVPSLHACGFTLDMIEAATGINHCEAVALIREGGPRPC